MGAAQRLTHQTVISLITALLWGFITTTDKNALLWKQQSFCSFGAVDITGWVPSPPERKKGEDNAGLCIDYTSQTPMNIFDRVTLQCDNGNERSLLQLWWRALSILPKRHLYVSAHGWRCNTAISVSPFFKCLWNYSTWINNLSSRRKLLVPYPPLNEQFMDVALFYFPISKCTQLC